MSDHDQETQLPSARNVVNGRGSTTERSAMSDFQINTESRDQAVIAHLRGDAGNQHADDIRDAFTPILKQRVLRVVLDLSELAFIASMALGELITFRRDLQTYGGQLRLAGANPAIADVFRKTRLVELFPMFPDPDHALADNAAT